MRRGARLKRTGGGGGGDGGGGGSGGREKARRREQRSLGVDGRLGELCDVLSQLQNQAVGREGGREGVWHYREWGSRWVMEKGDHSVIGNSMSGVLLIS